MWTIKLCPYRFQNEEDQRCIQEECIAFERTKRDHLGLGDYCYCAAIRTVLEDSEENNDHN